MRANSGHGLTFLANFFLHLPRFITRIKGCEKKEGKNEVGWGSSPLLLIESGIRSSAVWWGTSSGSYSYTSLSFDAQTDMINGRQGFLVE